jgi:hypothetical protein
VQATVTAELLRRHVISAMPAMSEDEWLATYAPKQVD